jgi:tetratricopeptide repeat protein 21B
LKRPAYKLQRYTNNPNDALKEFNSCRRDPEWGQDALYHMIELFLNPDNDIQGGEALESITDSSTAGSETENGESDMLAILTADKLLKVCMLFFYV